MANDITVWFAMNEVSKENPTPLRFYSWGFKKRYGLLWGALFQVVYHLQILQYHHFLKLLAVAQGSFRK